MWRPWRVRRRLTGAAAPAADGAGLVEQQQGTRNQYFATGAEEAVERDSKGHDNRHQLQERLPRRTSRFLGIRKRDTVRVEETGRHLREIYTTRRAPTFLLNSPVSSNNNTARRQRSTRTCAYVNALILAFLPRGTEAPFFLFHGTHKMRKISVEGQKCGRYCCGGNFDLRSTNTPPLVHGIAPNMYGVCISHVLKPMRCCVCCPPCCI